MSISKVRPSYTRCTGESYRRVVNEVATSPQDHFRSRRDELKSWSTVVFGRTSRHSDLDQTHDRLLIIGKRGRCSPSPPVFVRTPADMLRSSHPGM